MRSLLLLAALGMTPASAADRQTGRETTIAFAANGGLRDWTAGPAGSNIVYVRDRDEHWYRVTLTGACAQARGFDTFIYTTDSAGTFDTFLHVSVARFPDRRCGVTSIRTSPPPGQPGAPKPAR